jgi:hypothetical protein
MNTPDSLQERFIEEAKKSPPDTTETGGLWNEGYKKLDSWEGSLLFKVSVFSFLFETDLTHLNGSSGIFNKTPVIAISFSQFYLIDGISNMKFT